MSALNRKLIRELRSLTGQVFAIGLIVAAGVMVLMVTINTLYSLQQAQQKFYHNYHFAEVFADVTRAPEHIAQRVQYFAGVNQVETRIKAPLRLELSGFDDPIQGLVLSVPDGHQTRLNQSYLVSGSLPEPWHQRHVVVSEPFATAHQLEAGDTIQAILNGQLQTLTITGTAISPEFVYQLGPGDILPDYKRFGVFWMNRSSLAAAFEMEGAFNSISLTLQRGASADMVVDLLDDLLHRYGAAGAYTREHQISHRFLEEELSQMRVMSWALPVIFLGVATFLIAVMMARIIRTQRQSIALLKAFGYSHLQLSTHYALFSLSITLSGAAIGVLAGFLAGDALMQVYAAYFSFPALSFEVQPGAVAFAFLLAAAAGLAAARRAITTVLSMAPAEAMRPPAPEVFRQGLVDSPGVRRLFSQSSRIIIRNLTRHPFRVFFSTLGIALSAGLIVVGAYMFSAVDQMLSQQYREIHKMDLHVTFNEPVHEQAVRQLHDISGVNYAEGYRAVPVRLVSGRHQERVSLQGLPDHSQLRGLPGYASWELLSQGGVLLTDFLAQQMNLQTGQSFTIEFMDGTGRSQNVELAGVISEPLGSGAYVERTVLNQLLHEGPVINGAWLLTDSDHSLLYEELNALPYIASVGQIAEAEQRIRTYIADSILIVMSIMFVLAGSITFAVVYNNARIIFSERERELSTLRVLGMTKAETAKILSGELLILVAMAIPLGWLIGTGFAWSLNQSLAMDMYRIPFNLSPAVFAYAFLGTVLATIVSLTLVLRKLMRLDFLSALKTE